MILTNPGTQISETFGFAKMMNIIIIFRVDSCSFVSVQKPSKGDKVYDVPMSAVCLGMTFSCELEPNNDFDSNEIRPLMNRLSREIATSSDP